MGRPAADGKGTHREHLQSVAGRNPHAAAELQEPEFPEELAEIWRIFRELNEARGSGFGVSPISFTEIHHWQQLHGVRLTPYEVRVIRSLDLIFINAGDTRDGNEGSRPGGHPVEGRDRPRDRLGARGD